MKKVTVAIFAVVVALALRSQALAGCTTAVAVTTSSTAILAANDLGAGAPRSIVSVTNSGPGVAYCAFGTSNAATTANGFALFIGETLSFATQQTPYGKVTLPPQSDLACISFTGGGNNTSNVVACDY